MVTFAILPPVVLANLGLRHTWARVVTVALLVGAIVFVLLSAVTDLAEAFGPSVRGAPTRAAAAAAGALLLVCVAAAAALLTAGARRLAARVLPLDPASVLDEAALVGVILLIGNEFAFQLTNDALAKVTSGAALDRLDVIFGELPLFLVAVLGAGVLTRRSLAAGLQRLGLVVPTPRQVLLGLAAAGVFYGVSVAADLVQQILAPDLAHRLNNATGHFYGRLQDPIGIAVIALAAGIAEEALFRGALQPRLGLVVVALAFASVHAQYGLSIDTLVVLILGLGLGLIRKYANTTTSTITHVTYNALAGIAIVGPLMAPAIAIESLLLLALVASAGSLRSLPFKR